MDADIALKETRKRTQALFVGYVLTASLLSIILIAIWRNISAGAGQTVGTAL